MALFNLNRSKKREIDKSIKRKAIKLQETEMREIRDALHLNLNKKYINISTTNAHNLKNKINFKYCKIIQF